MAIGAIRRLRELGKNVPRDISIVGFDNAPLSSVNSPPLTTVAQDRSRIGITACALLDTLMRGVPINRVVLPPTLVIRASTKNIKSKK
jgi:DNA-binding LacI/PurR family transcriptional regulator